MATTPKQMGGNGKPAAAAAPAPAAAAAQTATSAPPAAAGAGVGALPLQPPQPLATLPQGGALAMPDGLLDTLEGLEGAGMEQVGARDVLIPRLTILQSLSPQCKKTNIAYIEGAEPGMICDVGLGQLMPVPLHVVPVKWSKSWIEWAPRASGKGIVAIHGEEVVARCSPNERGVPSLNGNTVLETAQWYVMNLSAGGRPSFIAMASTQLKRSRRWMGMAQAERVPRSNGKGEFCPPLFYRTYNLMPPALETRGADQEWYSWVVERGPALPELPNWENLLGNITLFRDSISNEQMRADLVAATDNPAEGDGDVLDQDGNKVERRM